jgi:hypothetical protein
MRTFSISAVEGTLTLRCDPPRASHPYESWEYEAELEAHSLTARVKVYDHVQARFHEFFVGLARDWKGWPSARHYESLEPMLRISAEHNGKGIAKFTVLLRAGSSTNFDWSASQQLSVELGRLQTIAQAANEFTKEA